MDFHGLDLHGAAGFWDRRRQTAATQSLDRPPRSLKERRSRKPAGARDSRPEYTQAHSRLKSRQRAGKEQAKRRLSADEKTRRSNAKAKANANANANADSDSPSNSSNDISKSSKKEKNKDIL